MRYEVLLTGCILSDNHQSNLYKYSSIGAALRSVAQDGPRGLLKGFVASSLRDAPYAGIFVVLYEGVKHSMCTSNCLSNISFCTPWSSLSTQLMHCCRHQLYSTQPST
jgi:hypothetical protein